MRALHYVMSRPSLPPHVQALHVCGWPALFLQHVNGPFCCHASRTLFKAHVIEKSAVFAGIELLHRDVSTFSTASPAVADSVSRTGCRSAVVHCNPVLLMLHRKHQLWWWLLGLGFRV